MTDSILGLCEGLPERNLEAGETLINCGGRAEQLFILKEGQLEVFKDGVQINIQQDPGAILGEVSVLLDIPHTASVRAVNPAKVYVVENAKAFLRSHPDITFFVSKLLARRLKNVSDYLVDIKRQYEDEEGHLSMVDEVLESLVHQQDEDVQPGSDRYPDATI
jgi:CRP-like cAMP-binding protein